MGHPNVEQHTVILCRKAPDSLSFSNDDWYTHGLIIIWTARLGTVTKDHQGFTVLQTLGGMPYTYLIFM